MIDVVIVTYNRKPLLFRNLDRLKSSSLIRKVIVVDNASADGTLREGRVRYPDVHWIASPANEGCIAWNRGMEAVRTPWALILDDDCFVQDAPLEQACAFAARTPSIGLAAFNVISEKTGSSEWGATIDGIRTATDWPNAIGACMLTNTQAFRSVGGYKDFFLCFNDLELVLNLWRNGYRVVFHPDWTACHLGTPAGSFRKALPIRNSQSALDGLGTSGHALLLRPHSQVRFGGHLRPFGPPSLRANPAACLDGDPKRAADARQVQTESSSSYPQTSF